MTAKEIRDYRRTIGWKSEDPNLPLYIQIEIAAQLADLNEHLRLTTPNVNEKRSRYEGL